MSSSLDSTSDYRPPLSKTEAQVVTALKQALQTTNSAFCCTGYVPLKLKRPVIFYATVPMVFATDEKPVRTPISAG